MTSEELHTQDSLKQLLRQVEKSHEDPGDHLCCANCHTPVTTSNEKTTLQSLHTFHVANPNGMEFNLACFSEAWGCGAYGEPSVEDSWFAGYSWQTVGCLCCNEQLGWFFFELSSFSAKEESEPNTNNGMKEKSETETETETDIEKEKNKHFFGLIIERLLPIEAEKR